MKLYIFHSSNLYSELFFLWEIAFIYVTTSCFKAGVVKQNYEYNYTQYLRYQGYNSTLILNGIHECHCGFIYSYSVHSSLFWWQDSFTCIMYISKRGSSSTIEETKELWEKTDQPREGKVLYIMRASKYKLYVVLYVWQRNKRLVAWLYFHGIYKGNCTGYLSVRHCTG